MNRHNFVQRREWDAKYLGKLMLVSKGGRLRIAEVLKTDDLPPGRQVPGDNGKWIYYLGTTEYEREDRGMKLYVLLPSLNRTTIGMTRI